MIPPTPGASDASRLFGYAVPPDGAGPIGPDQYWPQKLDVSREDMLHSLNPLQYVPVVGTIYRAATGEQIPYPMRVLGAGLTGGPIGALGAAFMGLIEELCRMGSDQSRPAAPAGMASTGSEAGVEPISPGTLEPGAYLTLATTTPEFLQSPTMLADAGRGAAAYLDASSEWRRSEWLEKGLA